MDTLHKGDSDDDDDDDNNNRFKIRRCMNVHYDIMLKTTENNNAMRW